MESLKNLLGDKSKTLSRIKGARDSFANRPVIKKAEYKQAQGVAVFKDWKHFETWEFCLKNKVTFEDWCAEFQSIMGYYPGDEYTEVPKSIILNNVGDIDKSVYDRAVTRDGCKICFNTGRAYLIKGIIFYNGKPDNLVMTVCWCRR